MTKGRRVREVLTGLAMILCAILLALFTEEAYPFITLVLALSLLLSGIRMLVFYLRMARYMVGGRAMLYRSIILIDLGLFTVSLTQIPLIYVVLYLAGIHIFTGAIDILRSMEARGIDGRWKLNMVHGIVNILIAALCLFNLKSTVVAVEIYCLGLAWSGIIRIIQAFRKQAIVYIQ